MTGNGVKFFKIPNRNQAPIGYDSENGKHKASLIAVLVPHGSCGQLPNPLNIEGNEKYNYATADATLQNDQSLKKRSAFIDADCLSEKFRLHEFSRPRGDPASETFIAFERTQNTLCYRGHQFSWDATAKSHTAVSVNTGHWSVSISRRTFTG